jgi:predicted acylesterase/phospholipase RssA
VGKTALILGGGSPNMTLMAGALEAFERAGVRWDVISTAGAGTLIGLLYAAPKGIADVRAHTADGTVEQRVRDFRLQALRSTLHLGVSDDIYRHFPVNYKAFYKPGVAAELYRRMLRANPWARLVTDRWPEDERLRFWSDWVQFWWACWSPGELTAASAGLCANVPFIDEIVDFDALADFESEFYISAYNIHRGEMVNWNKAEIDKDRFLAAFSFPLIYPPHSVDGEPYYEGAAVDCLNFAFLVNDEPEGDGAAAGRKGRKPRGLHPDIDTLVVLDVLGDDRLIHQPRRPYPLYDAWVQQIIVPLVELARDDLKIFQAAYNRGINPDGVRDLARLLSEIDLDALDGDDDSTVALRARLTAALERARGEKRKVIPVRFELGDDQWATALDWSRSNLTALYDIGRTAAEGIIAEHGDALTLTAAPADEPPARRPGGRPPRVRSSLQPA